MSIGLRLLALDPAQEPVHRTLMRLYAQQVGAALRSAIRDLRQGARA